MENNRQKSADKPTPAPWTESLELHEITPQSTTSIPSTESTPPKWGDLLRYTTDDRDITQHQLCIMQGGNGDWYVSIAESPDHYPTNAIRLCTSGGAAHACPGLGRAIAAAYRALYNQAHGIDTDAEAKAAAEAMADTMSLDELIAETQAQNAQLVEQNIRLIQQRNQALQDIAELNTRLHTFNQDHLLTLTELRAQHERLKSSLPKHREALETGLAAWELWANHWRTSPAYGNNQPENHPNHEAEIDKIKAAIAQLPPP